MSRSYFIEGDDSVQVIGVHGCDGSDDVKWELCPPHSTKNSSWWDHFMKFNPLKHLGMNGKAVCKICFANKILWLGKRRKKVMLVKMTTFRILKVFN